MMLASVLMMKTETLIMTGMTLKRTLMGMIQIRMVLVMTMKPMKLVSSPTWDG